MISRAKHIRDTKGLLGNLPTVSFPVPDRLYIATDNARCKTADVYVKEGDHVYLGQLIGLRHGAFFDQPIHSTCSGTFIGKEKHYHRSGKIVDFLVLSNDHKDEWDPSIKPRTIEEIEKLTRSDFASILEQNASVGLGGSSFPTHVKFKTDAKINTILINAVECEPYITADQRALLEFSSEIISGMKLVSQAFQTKDIRLCIKGKHKEIIAMYQNLLARVDGYNFSVSIMDDFFPQGWELAMIKKALGIEIPQGKLPAEYGVVDFNVSTIVGIHHSIVTNTPVYERLISISGDGIANPTNFKVRVGTHVRELLPYCGGYKGDEKKILILGGPMMGASLPSDDAIITKTVTSLIVLNEEEYKEEPCIRCGSCILSCPSKLMPVLIMKAVKAGDRAALKELNPLKCIECGLCAYSCTSKIHVTDYIRKAKILAKL